MPQKKHLKKKKNSKFLKALAASGSALTLMLALGTSVYAGKDNKDTNPQQTSKQIKTGESQSKIPGKDNNKDKNKSKGKDKGSRKRKRRNNLDKNSSLDATTEASTSNSNSAQSTFAPGSAQGTLQRLEEGKNNSAVPNTSNGDNPSTTEGNNNNANTTSSLDKSSTSSDIKMPKTVNKNPSVRARVESLLFRKDPKSEKNPTTEDTSNNNPNISQVDSADAKKPSPSGSIQDTPDGMRKLEINGYRSAKEKKERLSDNPTDLSKSIVPFQPESKVENETPNIMEDTIGSWPKESDNPELTSEAKEQTGDTVDSNAPPPPPLGAPTGIDTSSPLPPPPPGKGPTGWGFDNVGSNVPSSPADLDSASDLSAITKRGSNMQSSILGTPDEDDMTGSMLGDLGKIDEKNKKKEEEYKEKEKKEEEKTVSGGGKKAYFARIRKAKEHQQKKDAEAQKELLKDVSTDTNAAFSRNIDNFAKQAEDAYNPWKNLENNSAEDSEWGDEADNSTNSNTKPTTTVGADATKNSPPPVKKLNQSVLTKFKNLLFGQDQKSEENSKTEDTSNNNVSSVTTSDNTPRESIEKSSISADPLPETPKTAELNENKTEASNLTKTAPNISVGGAGSTLLGSGSLAEVPNNITNLVVKEDQKQDTIQVEEKTTVDVNLNSKANNFTEDNLGSNDQVRGDSTIKPINPESRNVEQFSEKAIAADKANQEQQKKDEELIKIQKQQSDISKRVAADKSTDQVKTTDFNLKDFFSKTKNAERDEERREAAEKTNEAERIAKEKSEEDARVAKEKAEEVKRIRVAKVNFDQEQALEKTRVAEEEALEKERVAKEEAKEAEHIRNEKATQEKDAEEQKRAINAEVAANKIAQQDAINVNKFVQNQDINKLRNTINTDVEATKTAQQNAIAADKATQKKDAEEQKRAINADINNQRDIINTDVEATKKAQQDALAADKANQEQQKTSTEAAGSSAVRVDDNDFDPINFQYKISDAEKKAKRDRLLKLQNKIAKKPNRDNSNNQNSQDNFSSTSPLSSAKTSMSDNNDTKHDESGLEIEEQLPKDNSKIKGNTKEEVNVLDMPKLSTPDNAITSSAPPPKPPRDHLPQTSTTSIPDSEAVKLSAVGNASQQNSSNAQIAQPNAPAATTPTKPPTPGKLDRNLFKTFENNNIAPQESIQKSNEKNTKVRAWIKKNQDAAKNSGAVDFEELKQKSQQVNQERLSKETPEQRENRENQEKYLNDLSENSFEQNKDIKDNINSKKQFKDKQKEERKESMKKGFSVFNQAAAKARSTVPQDPQDLENHNVERKAPGNAIPTDPDAPELPPRPSATKATSGNVKTGDTGQSPPPLPKRNDGRPGKSIPNNLNAPAVQPNAPAPTAATPGSQDNITNLPQVISAPNNQTNAPAAQPNVPAPADATPAPKQVKPGIFKKLGKTIYNKFSSNKMDGNSILHSQGILGIDNYKLDKQQQKIYLDKNGKPMQGNLNEKIALEVAFTDKQIDLANLTPTQKSIINNIEKAGQKIAQGKIDQEIISGVKELSSEFIDQVANLASSDKFANGKSKGVQALANYIAQSKLSDAQRASVKKITDEQLQNSVNIGKEAIAAATNSINARMSNIGNPALRSADSSGVAAGGSERDSTLGSWASGIYGVNEQNNQQGAAGYSGKLSGGSAGVDFQVKDNTILGFAYSYIASSFKYKASRMGDKVDATSNILSFYGKSELSDNVIWEGIFSASFSKVKNKRIEHFNDKVANAEFNNNSYVIDNNLGYKFDIDEEASFTPNVGVRYSYFNDDAYQETGVGTFNKTVKKRSSSELKGIIGAKIAVTKQFENGLKLMPSLHISAENVLTGKQQKVKAKFGWEDNYSEIKGSKAKSPSDFNIGGSVVAQKGNIEVSAVYEYNFHKKYQSSQGALKLKIMF